TRLYCIIALYSKALHPITSLVFTGFTSLVPFFFFNETATTEIYTLSLHDALPISAPVEDRLAGARRRGDGLHRDAARAAVLRLRSEEHTSELQSLTNLVCRLLLEKKKASARPTTAAAPTIIGPAPRHRFTPIRARH